MKLYMQYINNYEKLDQAFKNLSKNTKFKSWLKKVELKPELQKLDHSDFFIMPNILYFFFHSLKNFS